MCSIYLGIYSTLLYFSRYLFDLLHFIWFYQQEIGGCVYLVMEVSCIKDSVESSAQFACGNANYIHC